MASELSGIARIVKAFGYSLAGLRAAMGEAAFRQEAALCVIGLPLALWLGQSAAERALLVFSLLLVPVVELLNSAIEAAIDRISSERHPLSGKAKDMGSAAVLLALLNAGIIWAVILLG